MTKQQQTVAVGQYKDLCAQLFPLISSKSQALIDKAFRFAHDLHNNVAQHKKPFSLIHAVKVASIVSMEMGEMNIGPVGVVVAMLHDVLKHTNTSLAVLEQNFGKKIALMVEGVTKLSHSQVVYSGVRLQILRNLLSITMENPEIILIKIADRLDTIRSIDRLPKNKQFYVALETKEIYGRLANLLGLESIKREVNDICLRIMYPKKYYMLSMLVEEYVTRADLEAKEILKTITPVLEAHDILCQQKVRAKSISSIYDKMRRKKISFWSVYDLLGIRLTIPNKDGRLNCWRVYGIITSRYRTVRSRTKDWITKPKRKYGYESLHITILGRLGSSIEVQIRTERMHEIATKGSAAHWRYKEKELSHMLEEVDPGFST